MPSDAARQYARMFVPKLFTVLQEGYGWNGLQAQPWRVIQQMQLQPRDGELHFVADFQAPLQLARTLVGEDGQHDGGDR